MAGQQYYPGASGDDYFAGSEVLITNDVKIIVGRPMSETCSLGVRFVGVTIPRGAIIQTAHITFHAHETRSGYLFAIVRGNNADDAVAPLNLQEFSGLVPTTAQVLWDNVPDMTAGEAYDTPDLSAIIQEIVNRPGWTSGNAIQIKIGPYVAPNYGRTFRSKDHPDEATEKPELHVVFFEGAVLDFDDASLTVTVEPSFELFAPAGLIQNLPGLTCEGEIAVRSLSLEQILPGMVGEANLVAGNAASLDRILPGLVLEAYMGASAVMIQSGLVLEASLLAGTLARLSQNLPLDSIEAHLLSSQALSLIRDLPRMILYARMSGESFLRLDALLGGVHATYSWGQNGG